MNRFNLTFSGEILPGHEPDQVKLRFGKMFAIDDPVRLERFFSGQTIILRRNLERKAAAQCFQDLRQLGVSAELVKIVPGEAANSPTGASTAKKNASKNAPDSQQDRQQTWAVSANQRAKKTAAAGASGPAPGGDDNLASADDSAANKKAREDTARQQVAEKDARSRAQQAENERQAVAAAAHQQALALERERQAQEEAVRKEALRLENARIAAEEAARQAALEAQAKRVAAADAARREAELAEKKRLTAEAAARKQAEKAAARRKAAEEAAQRKAEKEREKAERARRKAQEAARQKVAREEAARKAQEEAARRKAELAEKKRLEAAEAARRKAELEEQKRRQEEAAARHRAEEEDAKQRAVEEAARVQAKLDSIKHREMQEAAQLQVELEEIQRQEAAEAARVKAAAERRKAEAERKYAVRQRAAAQEEAALLARQRAESGAAPGADLKAKAATPTAAVARERARQQTLETNAERQGMEDKATQRAARELAQTPSLKTVRTQVKTNLEVPQRKKQQQGAPQPPAPRKRQAGAANLYMLRPFRNTSAIRERAQQATQRMRRGLLIGGVALAGLLVLSGSFLRLEPATVINSPEGIAIDDQSRLYLLAGDWLLPHDRAGVASDKIALAELGLATLLPPLAFDSQGRLLGRGALAPTTDQVVVPSGLLRCELVKRQCAPIATALDDVELTAFEINSVNDNLFAVDSGAGRLWHLDSDGKPLASASIDLPENPVLRLHSGLLLMNSARGPAISIFRYDDKAFGQQLDEVLLLPPPAVELEQTAVADFIFAAGSWWVGLFNPASGNAGLYRFDAAWNYLGPLRLNRDSLPLALSAWGEKTLVNNFRDSTVQRFSSEGTVEAPLESSALEELIAARKQRASLTALAWLGGLLACALSAALFLSWAYLQHLRALVYRPHRERGAEPVDDYADSLQWIDPVPDRGKLLRRRGMSYLVLCLALVLVAMGQSVSTTHLACLLILLTGPATALLLLGRQPVGNIGISQDKLLLVDHTGAYHLGEGSRIAYRNAFILIDDVVVFTGSRLLPAFAATQLVSLVRPLVSGGIKVDRKTLLVKLLEARHPLAQGTLAIIASVVVAIVVLVFRGAV